MNKRDVLKRFANEWRSLAAWGAVLPMAIEIREDKIFRGALTSEYALGRAYSNRCTAYVIDTGELAMNLSTILHEMAHLAAPSWAHHEMPWRQVYARAAAEALKCRADDFDLDVDLHALREQVIDAVKLWLDRTGQTTVLTAIGVLP